MGFKVRWVSIFPSVVFGTVTSLAISITQTSALASNRGIQQIAEQVTVQINGKDNQYIYSGSGV